MVVNSAKSVNGQGQRNLVVIVVFITKTGRFLIGSGYAPNVILTTIGI